MSREWELGLRWQEVDLLAFPLDLLFDGFRDQSGSHKWLEPLIVAEVKHRVDVAIVDPVSNQIFHFLAEYCAFFNDHDVDLRSLVHLYI